MNYTKLWLIMRLTTVILLITLMQVSAAGFAQKMTFVKKGATLEQIFTEIRKQTGYFVVYADNKINDDARLDVNFKNTELKDVLDVIGNSQNLNYSFAEKNISFKPKEPSFLERIVDRLAAIDVRGRVVDENGQPMSGATVKVKGTNRSVTTNEQGEFYLQNVSEEAVLQITYVGYKLKEVSVANELGDIKMEVGDSDLEEVSINAGYYTTTERLKTGNIEKVTSKDIERQPVTSPLLALQGRMAGVDVSPSSGAPGGNVKIEIRGRNSLRFDGAYPLYIIDGVPVDATPVASSGAVVIDDYDPLNAINPSNIESIEVLKDADATSIYGSRGANGVILITTKRARKDGTSVDFNVYRGIGQVAKKMDMLNTKDYLAMRREAFKNNNNQVMTEGNAADFLVWDTTSYTDWQDVFYGGTSDVTDIQAGMSGGNNKTFYRFGAGYHNETTVFPGDFHFRRFTGNFSLNHTSLDNRFKAMIAANYGVSDNQFFNAGNPITDALNLPPNAPALLNEDGTLNWQPNSSGSASWTNPLAAFRLTNDANQNNLIFNSTLDYHVGAGFTIKANLGFNDLNSQEILKTPVNSYDPEYIPYLTPESLFSDGLRRSWIIEPQIHFLNKFGAHAINVIVGTTFQQGSAGLKQINASGYASDALLGSLQAASNTRVSLDQNNEYLYTSLFARVGYNFSEKYLLNFTARRDGSSRFGANNRFGNFGAIGAAWIFSKENWIAEHFRFVSFGKLRASLGTTGNDQIGDYKYLNTYSIAPNKYTGSVGLIPTSLYNPGYKWEVNKKMEAAAEFAFFENRISVEVASYRNRSTNQLTDYQLPGTTGFGSVLKNLDATIQNSGWEYSLDAQIIHGKNFTWNTSANYSRSRNKLIKFEDIENSPYASQYVVGESLYMRRFYTYTGVDPKTGIYTFLDVDANGIINASDRTLIKDIGRSYFGGVNNSITYKRIELNFLLQFVKQMSIAYRPSSTPGKMFNIPDYIYNNRWIKEGNVTNFQKVSTSNSLNAPFSNRGNSDSGIEDSSFLRLKTLSLSYGLPSVLMNKLHLRQCTIYLQGQNLLTSTDYSGLDPETGSTAVPPLRIISLGIQIGL